MDEFSRATFDRLLEAVLDGAGHRESSLHGEAHWRAVTWTALELSPRVPGSDPLVGFLFGLLHDSQRLNDGGDPEHGPRAAAFTRALVGRGLLSLAPRRLDRLLTAITNHTSGRSSRDPTIGMCWDADRLNLWRIGVEPSPRFLSTDAAKDPAVIAVHKGLPGQHVSWGALHEKLRTIRPN
jgi:hypothetical protein